ncbi:hypothetical protein IQ265_16705 [Nodosilinea sp. LEGE 06152]|uniref:hypothetical protein n=1 Tax=Nodosilinea sp. LEGE 06152 TaxID=2777966 RepID=UPI001882837E|nr:hypothetical protein [Nodosilinea sp. LEGE 06152]MBE9158459.1 hypothetical protein [Nodosilinea sp. LEGE 06152]
MEISTFELLVKRIAPPPADPAVARRVVQGYFLTIANLEDRDFTYQLEFHVSRPNPVDPDRNLAGNAFVAFDIAGENTTLALSPVMPSPVTPVFTTRFRLPAKQTASVQLLPDLTRPGLLNEANPDVEIRGFVRLRLPALRQGIFLRPQSNSPVKVLLNPEVRGTFLPNDLAARGGDFDQINYPLELASGKGLNEVEPDRGFFPIDPVIVSEVVNDRPPLDVINPPMIDLSLLSPTARAEVLAETLAQVDPSAENLNTVSDLLSKLEIPIRMEPVNR